MIGETNGPKSTIFNSDEGVPKNEHKSISLIPYSVSSVAFFGGLNGSKAANPMR